MCINSLSHATKFDKVEHDSDWRVYTSQKSLQIIEIRNQNGLNLKVRHQWRGVKILVHNDTTRGATILPVSHKCVLFIPIVSSCQLENREAELYYIQIQ